MSKSKQITVGYAHNVKTGHRSSKIYTRCPKIQIQGDWLAELGFEIGSTLCIIATGGVIRIEKEVKDGN
jgi:hypothetical protein